MDSTYNPWTTSGVHKINQRKVRDKAVPSLHISTYWLVADNTVIITKPARDTVRSRLQNFISFFPCCPRGKTRLLYTLVMLVKKKPDDD